MLSLFPGILSLGRRSPLALFKVKGEMILQSPVVTPSFTPFPTPLILIGGFYNCSQNAVAYKTPAEDAPCLPPSLSPFLPPSPTPYPRILPLSSHLPVFTPLKMQMALSTPHLQSVIIYSDLNYYKLLKNLQ